MEAKIQCQCSSCNNGMTVPYWQIGMIVACPNCHQPVLINLNQPVSFWYETTYAQFIGVIRRLDDYIGVRKFLSDSFDIVEFELTNGLAVKSDGHTVTLSDLHRSIQQNPELQNALYNRRMDTELRPITQNT